MWHAGYSGSSQAKKLGLKSGLRVALDNKPPSWELADPPDGVEVVRGAGSADVVISFFRAEAELRDRLADLVPLIFPAGSLWVAWPRRAGGHTSDITENLIREHALGLGVVDVKVAAMDEDWSALKFVWRLENRGPDKSAGPEIRAGGPKIRATRPAGRPQQR